MPGSRRDAVVVDVVPECDDRLVEPDPDVRAKTRTAIATAATATAMAVLRLKRPLCRRGRGAPAVSVGSGPAETGVGMTDVRSICSAWASPPETGSPAPCANACCSVVAKYGPWSDGGAADAPSPVRG